MLGKFFELRKNGQIKATCDTYNECLIKLQKMTSSSWEAAMKHDGWKIVECVEKFVGGVFKTFAVRRSGKK